MTKFRTTANRAPLRLLAAGGVLCALLGFGSTRARAAVVFSEIMYHPVDGTLAGDEYEFIELYNTGSTTANLHGAQFTQGVNYTFTNVTLAASSYVVVVKNRAAFTNRYPSVTNIAPGFYGGSLNNGGEAVTITNASGSVYCTVTYGDAAPWPEWADALGASLQLRDPTVTDLSNPTNWCASFQYNGTPGSSGDCWQAQLLVNELLTHTDPPLEDAIEVYNASTNAVNLFGWYLSDQVDVRKKYRITNAVPVSPGGYAVFYQYQFDTNGLFDTNNIPFGLDSALGDSVYLTAADSSGTLTRIEDIQSVEASQNGVSFGRYPNGTGDFTTLRSLTFGTGITATNPPGDLAVFRTGAGAANALPQVGPLVISEIMYHPANDNPNEEFIELLNVSTGTVSLFDTLFPSNTWRLATAVDYAFPTGVTVAAGARVVVIGATNSAAFRATYGLSTNIPLYGPWTGQLDNAGESVRLYKPDPPQTNGFVPYVLVDRVDYGDSAPWPTAPDGNGPSLERLVGTNYGDTADNWFVGGPGGSPGVAPAGGFVNPQLKPAGPAAGQIVTVTVSVVAQPLPTQVLVRTVVNGVFSNRILRDNGVAPDAVSNDQTYSVSFTAPTNAWLYYRFQAYTGGVEAFVAPARETEFVDAPTLSMGDCNGGVFGTVQPQSFWTTYQLTGTVAHADCFYLYLNAAGEVLLDDVRMLDTGGTNHLLNSGFSSSLSGSWNTNAGNHSASVREVPFDEGTNPVLHVRATGPGLASSFQDSISASMSPNMTVGATGVLSFRARAASYEADRWYDVLVGAAPQDPVINEIMYHPAPTNEAAYEYIELYNPSAASVNLADWEMHGVGNFRFPTGTVLGAGAFLAVCANTSQITAAYGVTNVVGNWSGTLDNGGESITLYDGFDRAVDSVTYDDEPPWPVPPDGFGPSLERLNASSVSSTSLNWLASFADTGWRQVTWTGTVSAANGGFRFYLDFDGMCWLDDVSVKPLGGTNELVTNGDFESGTNGWSFGGNHARSRLAPGQGHGGGQALAVFGNVTRFTFPDISYGTLELYGNATSNCVRTSVLPATGGTYVVSWWARRERLAKDIVGVLDGRTNVLQLGNFGTPGRTNSVATTNAPIQFVSVTQSSNVVAVGYTNVVSALVNPAALVSNVVLKYRICATNTYRFTDRDYTNVSMRDDGVAPDAVANDGVYTTYAPAPAGGNQLVRYQVFAAASNGFSARSPATDDPSLDYGFWVQGVVLQTNIPNWQVLVDGDPVVYPINSRCCAVSPEGQVFTDIEIRHRGRPSADNTNGAIRSGVAIRMNNGRLYDAWFAGQQDGINFRSRLNDYESTYSRLISEQLSYGIQRQLGFPVPRFRPVVVWFNGNPSITTEVEAPQGAFLSGNGISGNDYVSRAGYTGRGMVGGDAALDNFDNMKLSLLAASNATKNQVVFTNLCYESVQHAVAFANLIGDGDQYFDWNMFQQRRSSDGRWTEYPWDLDICFDVTVDGATQQLGGVTLQSTNLHPYFQTTLHPSIWDTNFAAALGQVLFYPESGGGSEYTLPYRYRQQTTLWRDCYTWFTTNTLYPRIDALVSTLLPVYSQLNLVTDFLTDRVASAKQFVTSRRNFLLNSSWSDKIAGLWAATNVYNPSNVVINEVMLHPLSGGEYVELYNTGSQFIDVSRWYLNVADETYRLPFGAMLGPTSYLVVADTETALTNAFVELGDASQMVERYPGYRLWDGSLVFTTAVEYASRVLEKDGITLPNTGGTVRLLDAFSNVIDSVTLATSAPWPTNAAVSMEVVNPLADNSVASNWRSCSIVGTPGFQNSANADSDADAMADVWEQQIVSASSGSITSVTGVLPNADFDGDGLPNVQEFVIGSNPTVADRPVADLGIALTNGAVSVAFGTQAPTGSAYDLFSARLYTLQQNTNLPDAGWNPVTNFVDVVGSGGSLVFTNGAGPDRQHYRYDIRLRYKRP